MIDVFFDDIRPLIIKIIQEAKYEIIASVINFNDISIFTAFEQAIKRGVKIHLIIQENDINHNAPFNISYLQDDGAVVQNWDSNKQGEFFYSFIIADSAVLLIGNNIFMIPGISNVECAFFIKWEEYLIKKFLKVFEKFTSIIQKNNTINSASSCSFTDFDFVHIGKGSLHGFRNNKTGELVCDILFDNAKTVKEGVAAVNLNKRWGYINMNGVQIIQHIYEKAESFVEGLAVVRFNKKWGYINKKGVFVIPPIYEKADTFSEGLAIVELENELFFIDKHGDIKIKIQYDMVLPFKEGFSMVATSRKFGFIDKLGNETIPLEYDYAYEFRSGFAVVKLGTKYGVIDKYGKIVTPIDRELGSLIYLIEDI